MSKTIWHIIGWLTVLTTVLFLGQTQERFPQLPPEERTKFIAGTIFFTALLAAIASCCFFPKSRPFTLRIIGAVGVAGCIFNLIEGFRQKDFSQYPTIILFWLPGSIYLLLKGRINDQAPEQK